MHGRHFSGPFHNGARIVAPKSAVNNIEEKSPSWPIVWREIENYSGVRMHETSNHFLPH